MEYKELSVNWHAEVPYLFTSIAIGTMIYNHFDPITHAIYLKGISLHSLLEYSAIGLIVLASLSFCAFNFFDRTRLELEHNTHSTDSSERLIDMRTENKLAVSISVTVLSSAFISAGLFGMKLLNDQVANYLNYIEIYKILDGAALQQWVSPMILGGIVAGIVGFAALSIRYNVLNQNIKYKTDKQKRSKEFDQGIFYSIMQSNSIVIFGGMLGAIIPQILTQIFGASSLGSMGYIINIIIATSCTSVFIALAMQHSERQMQRKLDFYNDQQFLPFDLQEFDQLAGASALTISREDEETEAALRADGYNEMYTLVGPEGNLCIVCYDKKNCKAIVAFRGTVTPAEMKIDMDLAPARADFGENIIVHQGILKNLYNFRGAIDHLLSELSNQQMSDIELMVTGHSLGAAMGTLYSLYYQEKYYAKSDKKVRALVTGAPRIIYTDPDNPEAKLPNAQIYRIKQVIDVVQELSPKWLGAKTVGAKIDAYQALDPRNLLHMIGPYNKAGRWFMTNKELSFERNPISYIISSLLCYCFTNLCFPFFNIIVNKLISPNIGKLFNIDTLASQEIDTHSQEIENTVQTAHLQEIEDTVQPYKIIGRVKIYKMEADNIKDFDIEHINDSDPAKIKSIVGKIMSKENVKKIMNKLMGKYSGPPNNLGSGRRD